MSDKHNQLVAYTNDLSLKYLGINQLEKQQFIYQYGQSLNKSVIAVYYHQE
jgi:hypothetical protein